MPTAKGFTGQRADALSGLDYYGARYYDAVAGQFTSADTVASGLSPYAYVKGNPETLTDPTGHRYTCPTGDCGGGGDGNPPPPPATSPGSAKGKGEGNPCQNPNSTTCKAAKYDAGNARTNELNALLYWGVGKIIAGALISLAATLWLLYNGTNLIKELSAASAVLGAILSVANALALVVHGVWLKATEAVIVASQAFLAGINAGLSILARVGAFGLSMIQDTLGIVEITVGGEVKTAAELVTMLIGSSIAFGALSVGLGLMAWGSNDLADYFAQKDEPIQQWCAEHGVSACQTPEGTLQ